MEVLSGHGLVAIVITNEAGRPASYVKIVHH